MAKSSKKSRSGPRGKGMTQISISMPASLVVKIDAAAAAQNRNRSNFMAVAIQDKIESDGK